jgi:D-alanyl-D-alanine carboxypeptidase/D-alanyl-D-alanine-endopeptidase (penicillin-binding protein 4)
MFRQVLEPLVILLCCILLSGSAEHPSSLTKEIDRLNTDDAIKNGSWSLYAMAIDDGREIAAVNADKSLIPASTLKLFTTGAALKLFGADFRFKTYLETDGTFDSTTSTLNGNLYIRGTGDPSLDSKYFHEKNDSTDLERWADILRKRGIKTITGKVIGDASLFGNNPLPDGWTWGDIGQYYGAGTSALTYHDNSYTLVYTSSGNTDSARIVKTIPGELNFDIVSSVKTGGTKDEAYIYGAPYGNVHYIIGRIPKNSKAYEVDAALPDPAWQCAHDLQVALLKTRIRITQKSTTTTRIEQLNNKVKNSTKRTILHTHYSPPLSEIIYFTNLKSDNIYAEQLLRTIGYVNGRSSETADAIRVVKEFWSKQGVDTSGFFMTDGSGLSRSNAIITKQLAIALRAIASFSNDEYAVFLRSLPIAGKSGSLANIGTGTSAADNLKAKSGYITRARGYAGYVKTRSGKQICFSVLANNYTCTAADMRKKLERILVALADLP